MSSLLSRVFGLFHPSGGHSVARASTPAARPAASRPSRSRYAPQLRSDYSSDDSSTWTYPPQPVVSSNLSSVAYDFPGQLLEIRFHDSGVYRYSDVPLIVYRGLMDANSKGGYHHAHVKENYCYMKVS